MTVTPKILWKNGVRYGSEWQTITDFEEGVTGNLIYTIRNNTMFISGAIVLDRTKNPITKNTLISQHESGIINVPLFTLPSKYKYETLKDIKIYSYTSGYSSLTLKPKSISLINNKISSTVSGISDGDGGHWVFRTGYEGFILMPELLKQYQISDLDYFIKINLTN